MVFHGNLNRNYLYIKVSTILIFRVRKLFYYSTEDAILRKAFTDILNYRDIYFTYFIFYMANLIKRFIATSGIADIYNIFIKVTSKLHKTSSNIDFIKNALHRNVTPTFFIIRIQCVNNKDQLDAKQK